MYLIVLLCIHVVVIMSFNAFLVNMQRPGLCMICIHHSCVQSVFWSNTGEGNLKYDASTKSVCSGYIQSSTCSMVKYQLVLMRMLKENWMIQRPPQSTIEKLPAVHRSCSTLQRGERFCLAVVLFKNKPKWGRGGGGVRESKGEKLLL